MDLKSKGDKITEAEMSVSQAGTATILTVAVGNLPS